MGNQRSCDVIDQNQISIFAIGVGGQWISFGAVLGLSVQSSAISIGNNQTSTPHDLRFPDAGYVAQILGYESDILQLLNNVQLHVVSGNALYGAVYLCRFSGQPSAIEKRAITKASSQHLRPPEDQRTDSASPGSHAVLNGDLTLTLFHVDTTWRFDSFDNRRASPKLSWPTIRRFFTPGAFVEGDLILRDQHCHPDALRILPPAAHLLHVEISCGTKSDAAVKNVAKQLRDKLQFWTRQLLFELDPAHTQASNKSQDSFIFALLMEFDMRHTAETLATDLDTEALRKPSGEQLTSALVRVFTLEGSAKFHDMTPLAETEPTIDNRTHKQVLAEEEKLGSMEPPETTYFGLSSTSYVHH